ncbi:YbaB/EbfC family nucleoid-associated protein [Nocardia thailandica]
MRANAQQRIDSAMAEVRTRTFVGMSSDRTAAVRVSSSGVVLDIQLTNGFGDLRQPTWVATGEVNSAAHAIVEAVNAARSAAASAVAVQLSTIAGN